MRDEGGAMKRLVRLFQSASPPPLAPFIPHPSSFILAFSLAVAAITQPDEFFDGQIIQAALAQALDKGGRHIMVA
jgi:hypothetical protein